MRPLALGEQTKRRPASVIGDAPSATESTQTNESPRRGDGAKQRRRKLSKFAHSECDALKSQVKYANRRAQRERNRAASPARRRRRRRARSPDRRAINSIVSASSPGETVCK